MANDNVIMDHFANQSVWNPDMGDGTYKNPIIFADYSDPDVVRVGKDFFMVASSFHCMPGIPVLHSNDLVSWRIVNYVIDSLEFPEHNLPAHGKGAWAPSIKYHAGFFWVFVAMPDYGVFMSKTDDPFKKWSPLKCIKKVIGWIDPCPFWDDDGNAYLVNAFANSRIGFKSILRITRMNPDGTELLKEGKFVFDGQENHVTMEGPKLYKRNGYYYIFTPAGGVKYGWQTVLRSRNIFGPYEDKIVLHQGTSTVNGPHQGGWAELESGESWFIHFQDQKAYGRVVHLQPVEWVFDWPVIGIDTNWDGIGEPVMRYIKPDVGREYPVCIPQTSDRFDSGKLGLQWQWQANYKKEWYSLTERKNHLRLYSKKLPGVKNSGFADAPNILVQKFPAPSFYCETAIELNACTENDEAGITVMGEDYFCIVIRKDAGIYNIVRYEGAFRCDEGGNIIYEEKWEKEKIIGVIPSNRVFFRVSVKYDARCRFSYSVNGSDFTEAGGEFLARPGVWVGGKIGLFCINRGNTDSGGSADFEYFKVDTL